MNTTAAVPPHVTNYKSFRGLPPLGGLCAMGDATKPGLSVEECVRRLKRHHYVLRRLHQVFTARITAEPIYELKSAFSLHSHYCAEHTSALRKRVTEMREPPYGLDAVPDAALEIFCDEILAAPTTEELVLGLYEKALPALKAALERHIADTNPLVDAPSVRVCRFALLEVGEMLAFGAQAVACLVDATQREAFASWLTLLDECIEAAGGMDGAGAPISGSARSATAVDPHAGPEAGGPAGLPARRYSAEPFRYDGTPRRDARFPDPYNMGVNAEVFLYDAQMPPEPKTLMMFYKRLREIDVPEMMASIITETPGKPWEYYRDMTRQLWDEARHAMMGEVGFAQLGVDWPREVMVNFTWSLGLNTQLTPIERHAVLYFIEQGLMPRNGKRFEWEVGLASDNPLSALFQDYDWADEVLHARVGRDWYLTQFSDPKTAVKYGDDCWSRVLMNWGGWREQGLTQHRNWWPGCYQAACRTWGVKPDERVLSFRTSYEQVRADLKAISGSA